MEKRNSHNQSGDQSEEDEESLYVRRNIPRFTKHTLEGLNFSKIIINISNTQYPVLQTVAAVLGWKAETAHNQTWDIFWTDHAIQSEQLFRLQDHQKINHFPGMYTLARKNLLGRGLMRMRKQFPDDYNFFPLTWMVPSQLNQFSVYFETSNNEGCKNTYIVKPQASSQGKGIFLTRKLQDLSQTEQNYIVQKYIDKPYLINGLKFDFRIYVLLAGCNPLRIYVYREGLARFATQKYKKPKKKNLKQACMHLTNYAINKQNPNFIFNKSDKKMDVGHKRSLTSVFKLLQGQGVDVNSIHDSIHDSIIKTIITGQPLLAHLYKLSQPQNYSNDMCFQILGFDVLLDENLKPILLQVNHTPSFKTDTPLDRSIKKNLIRDTLVLMNINLKTKVDKVNLKKQFNQLRSQRKKLKLTPAEKLNLCKEEQINRDKYEDNNLGNFQKIYPSKNTTLMEKYESMLKHSAKMFEEQTGMKKKYKVSDSENFISHNKIPTLITYSPPKKIQMRSTLRHKQIVSSSKKNQLTPTLLPILEQKQIKNIKSEQFATQIKQINKPLPITKIQYPSIVKNSLLEEEVQDHSKIKLSLPGTILIKKQEEKNQKEIQGQKKFSIGQYVKPKTFNMKREYCEDFGKKIPANFEIYLKRHLEQKVRSEKNLPMTKT